MEKKTKTKENLKKDDKTVSKKLKVGRSKLPRNNSGVTDNGASPSPSALSSPLPTALPNSFISHAEDGSFCDMQQVHQSSGNNCFASLGFLTQAAGDMTPNKALFSRDSTPISENLLSANIVWSPKSAYLEQFNPTAQQHKKRSKRVKMMNLHENSRCANCNTSNTSLWRRNDLGQVECNACNLYYRKNNRPRPLVLCKETIAKRRRKSSAEGSGDS